MAKSDFSFDFDEIRIQDTDQEGASSALDALILGEESSPDDIEAVTKEEKEDDINILDDISKAEEESTEIADEAILDAVEDQEEYAEEPEPTDQISSLVDNYYNLGIFTGPREEEPITTEEQLLARFEEEKKNGANLYLSQFLNKFGPDYHLAFQKIFVEGVDPKEYFSVTEPLQDISSLDLEQEENQLKVVRQYYKEVLGYSDERTESKLKVMKDAGELAAEASEAVDRITSNIEKQLQEKSAQKAREEAEKAHSAKVYDTSLRMTIQKEMNEGNFRGIPVNQQSMSQTYANLMTPAWRLPNGEEITDFQKFLLDLKRPENIEAAILIDVLRQNNFDLGVVQTRKENIQKSRLFDALATKETTAKRKNPLSNTAPPKKFI